MNDEEFELEEPRDTSLAARFATFDAENPYVWALFVRFAFDVIRAGHRHFSSDAILHRIRWATQVETTERMVNPDTGDFIKINNNWSAYYARKFADAYPKYSDLFRFRTLTSEG